VKKEEVANTVQDSALSTSSLRSAERFATLRIATEPRGVKLYVDGQIFSTPLNAKNLFNSHRAKVVLPQ